MAGRQKGIFDEGGDKSLEQTVFSLLSRRELWIGILIVVLVFGGINLRNRFLGDRGVDLGGDSTPSVNGGVSDEAENGEGAPGVDGLADVSGRVQVTVKAGDTFESLSLEYCGDESYAGVLREANGYQDRELELGDEVVVECVR